MGHMGYMGYMRYRTLSGSRKHPEINSIPDKRGERVFKLWQKWLEYYLEKNASRIEDLISSQKDLMTSDLDFLKKLQNIIKIECFLTNYLNGNVNYSEISSIYVFIAKENIRNYMVITDDELLAAQGALKKYQGLSRAEIEMEIVKMEARFDKLTNSEYYVFYELTMGPFRKMLVAEDWKAMADSNKSYLERISQEMVYSREIAKKGICK